MLFHQELKVKWRYGYVAHADQRGLYKLDLENLRFVRNVDLTPYNCVPNDLVFVARCKHEFIPVSFPFKSI